jgi:hypothetical protein
LTLVGGALAALHWEESTSAALDALRVAFAAGTREGPFTFADYDAVRREFAAAGIRTTPGEGAQEG